MGVRGVGGAAAANHRLVLGRAHTTGYDLPLALAVLVSQPPRTSRDSPINHLVTACIPAIPVPSPPRNRDSKGRVLPCKPPRRSGATEASCRGRTPTSTSSRTP